MPETNNSDASYQSLPAVQEILEALRPEFHGMPHSLLVQEVRRSIAAARDQLPTLTSHQAIAHNTEQALREWSLPSLRHVINATGVVLHTNLGRAPLTTFAPIEGYSNLEHNLSTGKRGKRDLHTGRLLEAILKRPAIVVNNGAAALFLVLNELAAGGEAIVSRGELIEIGDGFRIPDIMEKSGAKLREVGTTNRTTIDDYRNAITSQTRILLRVHPSNFRITGFTARPDLHELVALGKERNIPVYEDLGSGCIVDLKPFGIDEPLAQDSLAAGIDVITFSGDKLLGGPQGGIIAGNPDLIQRIRRNPLFRALRQDKLFYQVMEQTLRHILLQEWDAVPALRMIRMSADHIRLRADALIDRLAIKARVEPGESVIGGGSTPDKSLPTALIVIESENAAALERRLRLANPPVIARIEHGRVLIDLRTVLPQQEEQLLQALA